MTVQELMDILKDLDPDMEVIIQGDSEGNYYGECAGADTAMYDEEEGACVHPDDEDDEGRDLKEVLVIWPV